MNYSIIQDPDKLKEFIEWLPELEHDETFYLCLFARSKYCRGIAHVRSDKAQLKRFTSNKTRMYNKILQLECPVGAHTMKEHGKDNHVVVPQEALALYITVNPRSFIKTNTNSVKKLLDLALQPYNGFHPYQEVMSEVQKAKSKTRYITFDFDSPKEQWPEIWKLLQIGVNSDAMTVVETRGGFHVMVDPKYILPELMKDWHQRTKKVMNIYSSDTDNCGDIMLPVPGTYQGGFVQGLPMTFSILEVMEYTRSREINLAINSNIRNYLNKQGREFELSPVAYIHAVLEGVELNNSEEVVQFIFHAGYMFGLLESKLDDIKGEEDNQ